MQETTTLQNSKALHAICKEKGVEMIIKFNPPTINFEDTITPILKQFEEYDNIDIVI